MPGPHPAAESGGGEVAGPIDYRFSLANERTFLAWIRTALGLLAGGVAVQTLAEQFSTSGFRRAVAAACAGLAVAIAACAHRQWKRVEAAMTRGEHLPGSVLVPVLAVGVSVVTLAAGVAVLAS
ncbi:YidH family protein [Nocardia sp. NPDC059228]|uniref:YidH family protein n=1 Tax=Nocardia sp. NPDC059228 TaxID=3346777 RepID=UPI0036D14AEC